MPPMPLLIPMPSLQHSMRAPLPFSAMPAKLLLLCLLVAGCTPLPDPAAGMVCIRGHDELEQQFGSPDQVVFLCDEYAPITPSALEIETHRCTSFRMSNGEYAPCDISLPIHD